MFLLQFSVNNSPKCPVRLVLFDNRIIHYELLNTLDTFFYNFQYEQVHYLQLCELEDVNSYILMYLFKRAIFATGT